ncbi:CPBP family intramembrane metalloprotease [Aerococcaceae bacterium DSM 111022]|nr:CPBP family intramembrane metalloprotease [Aerococcaceae bacterium DSM 111022]
MSAALHSQIASTAVQVALFFLVGLVPHLAYYRRKFTLAEFFGLVPLKPGWGKSMAKMVLATLPHSVLTIYLFSILDPMMTGGLRAQSFVESGWSLSTVVIILLEALIQTSFTEEIAFRGYLINFFKRNGRFKLGNLFQAVLFALIHLPTVAGFSVFIQVSLVLSLMLMSLVWGHVIHKEQGGSVLLAWFLHGLTNTISGIVILMSI